MNIYTKKRLEKYMVEKYLITSAQASYTVDKDGNEIPFGARTGLKKVKLGHIKLF